MTGRAGATARGLAALAALWVALGDPASAQAQGEAYLLTEADWPCHGRYRLEFSAAAVWQGPPLDEASARWRADDRLRRVAEELAAPETMRRAAERLIADFAAGLPAETRGRRLGALFHGVLDEINLYRRFVLEGIVGLMGRRRLAAEVLAETEVELHGLAAQTTPEAAARRKDLETRRFWQARAYDSADGEAQFLCKRLNALERKLGQLAGAIAGQLAR